jgi:hypothetical protein
MSCLRLICYSFAVVCGLSAGWPAVAQETIKLAYTDPFSGPFASGGDEFLKTSSISLHGETPPAVRSAANTSWCRSTTSCSRPKR